MTTTATISWSPAQERAIAAVRAWLTSWHQGGTRQWFYLGGVAGSGKTSLAMALAQEASERGTVFFGAYTGKAALELQRRGCPGATTIHRLIYQPKQKSQARLVELQQQILQLNEKGLELSADEAIRLDSLRRQEDAEHTELAKPAFALRLDSEVRGASLVEIDECSMCDMRMGADLLSFGAPVLALGDPAQLPPVRGEGFFTGGAPDFFLDEVHRQAAGSPILSLATRVRTQGLRILDSFVGTGLEWGQATEQGRLRVVQKGVLKIEDLAAADQVLVGRNESRQILNNRIRREVLGRTSIYPVPGDKLVCLKNNHELGLLNGSLWKCRNVHRLDADSLWLTLDNDEGETVQANAGTWIFENRKVPHWLISEHDMFDYGYALTVHKAQGSQWEKVVLIDESSQFGHASRHLYTGITRAQKELTVVAA